MNIDPFPGVMTRSKELGTPYVLTEEQEEWFRRYFPICDDLTLTKIMGCSYMTTRRLATKAGLKKDRQVMRERFRVTMTRLVESERRRDRWGLTRRTSYCLPRKKYTHEQLRRRCVAVKRYGYILAEDYSDEGGHRYVIYYNNETQRNYMFERFGKKHGFTFKEWK